MGIYLNPDNKVFSDFINSDHYVDKTGLIKYMNGQIGKAKHLISSSRPRRFGKSLAVQMLVSYYSKGSDSGKIFSNMEISKDESFEQHLNKYDVICLDIQWMKTSVMQDIKQGNVTDLISYIHSEVIDELRQEYPECVEDKAVSLPRVLADITKKTKNQFVIIIDEWDCLFREDKENTKLQEEYIDFLRGLFKGQPAEAFLKLAYITGILPIKKYGTQSALNNFKELTMTKPNGISEYIGFTEQEVRSLCEEYNMSFDAMQKWYDGYMLNRTKHVYSPNSVMEALDNGEFQNYWTETETYESLNTYIEMDFDGLKQNIVSMLAGGRCTVDIELFQNDMVSFKSANEILVLLVHLGYLGYDNSTNEVFIPNEEVRKSFILSVKDRGWTSVINAIRDSEALLKATLAMDESKVAEMIQDVHTKHSSSLVYNNEISLASIIQLAYYSASRDYVLIREFPAGKGFADMVFIPKKHSDKPALIVELKWDQSAEAGIQQIKDRKYYLGLEDYMDNLLMVGIEYDRNTKKHGCVIERYNWD